LTKKVHVNVLTLFASLLTRPLLTGAAYMHMMYNTDIHTYFIRCGAAAGIFNAWNRAQNTIYNLAQSPHRKQHDREQQKDQEWRRFLLSDNDYDREDIIISIDDDISLISPSSSSNSEGTSSNDHNQKNPTQVMKNKQQLENKDRKDRVVSFRLSEPEYARYLSMAKLCHENGVINKPVIASFARVSMECLWQYINNSQAREELSAEKEENLQQPQEKQEGGVEQQQDVVDYHAVTASSPSRAEAATTNTAAMGGEQHTRESIARTPPQPPPTPPLFNNLHEYFQPVFDELDNLNKMLDSHIEEENDKAREKKK
jgi:hypothetical protein